jgi:hypothetical protein
VVKFDGPVHPACAKARIYLSGGRTPMNCRGSGNIAPVILVF